VTSPKKIETTAGKRRKPAPKAPANPPEQGTPEIIHVPLPPKRAFNPDRPLAGNSLLQAQVQHFHEIDAQLPDQHKMGIAPHQIRTEGEASEYIRKITARLHEYHSGRKVRKAT